MDRLVRHLFGVAWAGAELVVAAYDWATRRDPNADLKRFLAEHPEVTIYYPDGERQ